MNGEEHFNGTEPAHRERERDRQREERVADNTTSGGGSPEYAMCLVDYLLPDIVPRNTPVFPSLSIKHTSKASPLVITVLLVVTQTLTHVKCLVAALPLFLFSPAMHVDYFCMSCCTRLTSLGT